jgi:accessory gene regulator protein AgrB
MTITVDPTTDDSEVGGSQAEDSGGGAANAVLILRGARNAGPRVAWDNDVVDNEHMGKKKSKSAYPALLHVVINLNIHSKPQFVASITNLGALMNHPRSPRRRESRTQMLQQRVEAKDITTIVIVIVIVIIIIDVALIIIDISRRIGM